LGTPLQVLTNLTAESNGWVTVNSSTLVVTNGTFAIGKVGSGSRLTIASTGVVYGSRGVLGLNSTSSSNTVLVTDGGQWINNSEMHVGEVGAGNQLVITNGGAVYDYWGRVGFNSAGNSVLVSGAGSVWSNQTYLYLGQFGAGNSLAILNSGTVRNTLGVLGVNASGSNNTALVSGPGSFWNVQSTLEVGWQAGGNTLTVTNGATVFDFVGRIGVNSSNNVAVVAGNGARWLNRDNLLIGDSGSSNALLIASGGFVTAQNLYVGATSNSVGNRLDIFSGTLNVTNGTSTGALAVRGGTLTFAGGVILADRLYLTNGLNSVFTFNAGTLSSGGAAVTNSQLFTVGDGISAARYHLLGGTHSFANGLRIRSNGTLSGCGTVIGNVTVDLGGLVLGDCGGMVTFTGILTNNGTLRVINGGTLEAYGTVVNNGTIDAINGNTNFHGLFINNGTVLNSKSPAISQASKSGQDFLVQIPSVVGHTYRLQYTVSLTPTNWINTASPQSGTGGILTFTDFGGATNTPARFYHIQVTAP